MLAHIRTLLISNCVLFSLTALYAQTQRKDERVRELKSKEVERYINYAVNPCDDFYEFACGNYAKHNPISNDDEIITPESLAAAAIERNLINILSELVHVDDLEVNRKIKEFYKACLNAERNSTKHQEFLSGLVSKYGGFPAVPGLKWTPDIAEQYNWHKVVGQLQHDFNLNILIGISVDSNSMDEVSIFLVEPSTIIPTALCNAEITKKIDLQDDQFESIEKEVTDNLKKWLTLDAESAQRVAIDIITFEFELCKRMGLVEQPNDSSPPDLYYERKSLNEIKRIFNDSIDFVNLVNYSFNKLIAKPVHLKAREYYWQLIKTIAAHNTTTIANYIMYRVFDAFDVPATGAQIKRSNFCLAKTKEYFPTVVSDMFWSRNLQPLPDIGEMFNELKLAINESFKANWISDSSKTQAEITLSKLQLFQYINNTEEMDNLTWLCVDLKNYWTNLAQPMAQIKPQQLKMLFEKPVRNVVKSYDLKISYRSKLDRFEVGGGFQMEPFYHMQYPNAMRYALFGSKLAQELAIAFNDLSWTTNFLNVGIWNSHTSQGYRNRSQCFRQQITNYLYDNRKTYQNMTRVRELIARSGGLNIAFRAYLNWLHYKNANNDFNILRKETLQHVNYSNTQLFFIAYTQLQCRSQKVQQKAKPILSPLHDRSVERYEVNGPLQNSVEFALEFGCALGTHMNPVDKCIMY